jgi:hypothetical protein
VGVIGRTREPGGFRLENEGGREGHGVCPRLEAPNARAPNEAAAEPFRNSRREAAVGGEAAGRRMEGRGLSSEPIVVKTVGETFRGRRRNGAKLGVGAFEKSKVVEPANKTGPRGAKSRWNI